MNTDHSAKVDLAHYRHPRGTGTILLSATTLIGNSVVSHDGERLGTIIELMLDPTRGSVCYAVLKSGGFLGLGSRLFAVPWGALALDSRNRRFVLHVNVARFRASPGFDKRDWPDFADASWAGNIDAHYGVQRDGRLSDDPAP